MQQVIMASGIFSITFGLIVFKPKGITEGTAGALGALLMIISGLVNLTDVADILRDTGGILIMLFAMMVISIIVDEAGFFHWMAAHSLRLAKGNGRRLFFNTFIMGTIVTTVISNDATALIITPIVYSFVSALGINPIPFLLVCTFIADTASLSLPVSNLTNLLVYDQLGLSFMPYVSAMLLPTITAVIVNYVVFRLVFAKKIPKKYDIEDLPNPDSFIRNRPFFIAASVGLIIIILGYVVGSWMGVSLAYIAVFGALALMCVGKYYKQINEKKVFSQVSWSVLVFVVGMFIVVRGIQKTGLPVMAAGWLLDHSGDSMLKAIIYTSLGTAIGSNILNNVPMDMMMISVLKSMTNTQWVEPLAYSVILGAGLGPNLTVIGSLATMLWLGTIRRKGVNITTAYYLKIGILTAPLMIIVSSAALWLSISLLYH